MGRNNKSFAMKALSPHYKYIPLPPRNFHPATSVGHEPLSNSHIPPDNFLGVTTCRRGEESKNTAKCTLKIKNETRCRKKCGKPNHLRRWPINKKLKKKKKKNTTNVCIRTSPEIDCLASRRWGGRGLRWPPRTRRPWHRGRPTPQGPVVI